MPQALRLLLVEDSEDDATLLVEALRAGGYEPASTRVETAGEMRAALRSARWDLVVADYSLPRFDAPAALAILQETGFDLPFLVVSGQIGEETAVAMMKSGASDYVMKDNLVRLVPAVERALREAEGRRKRKELEAQMRRVDRLDSLGKLAGGIAHDFNNLLTGIMGFAQLGLYDAPKGSPLESALTQIEQLGQRGAALTQQILAFSRRQPIDPSIFDLNELVRRSLTMLQQLIGENIETQFYPADGLGTIHADPGQIEQVLTNLVVNGRDAMPNGGRLTIETGNAEFDEAYAAEHLGAKPGPYVLLSVTDTGCGMTEATLARLFEPFFTTKEAGKGTGLGLATAYGIVKKHGGNLWAYSEPGRGSTFKVYLPRVEAKPEPLRPKAVAATPARGTETLLLVEDQAQVRQVVTRCLESLGYTVVAASAPSEAEQRFAERGQEIALLLTDVVLPERTGCELHKRLSASRPGLKVLYMSGYAESAMSRGDTLVRGAAFLQKPFTPATLAAKVREVLDAGPRQDPPPAGQEIQCSISNPQSSTPK